MKIRSLLALLSIVILLTAACGSDASPDAPEDSSATESTMPENEAEPSADADTPTETATEAMAETPAAEGAETNAGEESAVTPVITVGVNAEFQPFAFLDANGNLAGFDIDLMNALNAEMDFEVAYATLPFEELLTALENGELDAAISAISVTDARRERVDFTMPYFAAGLSPVSYFSAGQGLSTRTDNQTITGVDSLTSDVTVGVKVGTTGNDYVAENTAAAISTYQEAEEVLQALVNGEVDAIVLDTPVIIRFIKANPGAAIKLVGGPLTEETYAIAVNKERPQVLEGLNEGLEKLIDDGTYDVIYNKWFGAP
jgi:arginine/lysine/histidine/glutamine transport system substrate-binding/permease protein